MGTVLCGVFLQKSEVSLVSKSRPGTFPRHAKSLPSQGDRMIFPLIWDSGAPQPCGTRFSHRDFVHCAGKLGEGLSFPTLLRT